MNKLKDVWKRPRLVRDVENWVFTFYYKDGSISGTYLEITSKSGIFGCHIGGNTHAYGYLFAAAEQGLDEQLLGYVTALYATAMVMTQDGGYTDRVWEAISRWFEKKDSEAGVAAGAVTEEADMADAAFMEGVAEYADAGSDKECEAVLAGWREDVREFVNEDSGDDGDGAQDN